MCFPLLLIAVDLRLQYSLRSLSQADREENSVIWTRVRTFAFVILHSTQNDKSESFDAAEFTTSVRNTAKKTKVCAKNDSTRCGTRHYTGFRVKCFMI
jgi:hypothetical protein